MKIEEMEDHEAVVRCLEGETAAFKQIMDRYKEYAMAIALNMLMNREDAEDACQDAFVATFRNLNRFDPRRNFKNWFASILCHGCLSRIRKRKRFRLFLGRFGSEQPMAFEAPSSLTSSLPDSIPYAMNHLGPKERLALYLWSREGFSGEEIAAVLGCSRKTAYVHLYRARVKLKTLLAEKTNAQL